jgi:hypothetical protein
MISAAPLQASIDLVHVSDKVRAFLAIAKVKAAGGLTVAEFGELAVALLRVVIAAVDSLPSGGGQKKQWAIDAIAALFDAVADKCVPTLAYPLWIVLRPAVRQLVLLAASGAIESLLPLVRIAA